MPLACRFYKNRLPETEDLVMVNVVNIEEMGVYVRLLEYNEIEGMILLTELSRRRIRSINKLIRVGRNEVVVVVRVDREKGYIDLSKRRVSPEDVNKCEEKFIRGKTVNSILRHTADVLGLKTDAEFEELYDKTVWAIDEKYKRAGAAYDVFARAVNDERELDDCKIDQPTKKILLDNIRRRLTPHAVKCRADVEVACYGYEGIDAVKAALKKGLSASTEEMPVKINLIAPPLYVITATCLDRKEGLAALTNVIEKIRLAIEEYRGIFKIKMEPKVVTDVDDITLKEAMQRAEDENRERSGDDDDDEDNSENQDDDTEGKGDGENQGQGVDSRKSSEPKRTTNSKGKTSEDDDNQADDDE